MRRQGYTSRLILRALLIVAMTLTVGQAGIGPGRVTDAVAQRQIVPLHRLFNWSTGDHLYTTDSDEAMSAQETVGYTYEGVAGFVASEGGDGLVPLHRLLKPDTGDHLYTTDIIETTLVAPKSGYTYEGAMGYLWEKPVANLDLVPLRRFYNPESHHHFLSAGRSASSDPEGDTAVDWLGYQEEGGLGLIRATPLELTVTVSKPSYYPHEPVELDIALHNRSAGPITMRFPSADTRFAGQITVLALSNSAAVWRSEDDGRFAQVLTDLTVKPGATLHQKVVWDQRGRNGFVASGAYIASAPARTLGAAQPITSPAVFTID